ncbi:deoxyhypusine synthase [Candidatus Woesearchaeota archaeon]|nr:deoxyhypusine synthase [Candidatus Woesearchaeota archaeon]
MLRKKNNVYPYNVAKQIDLSHLEEVKGYGFEKEFDFYKFIDSYNTTAFQATNFGRAVSIVNEMRKKKAAIFLSCTSNIMSSGLRESVRFLVKNRHIHFMVTSAGGIEEDIVKSLNPFYIGAFDVKGKTLFESGVARIGNIFVPVDRYTYFEKFMQEVFDEIYAEQKKIGRPLCSSEIIRILGKSINNEESVLYWAYKNNIPVVCPAIMDGSFGDLVYFFKRNHPDFAIDVTQDTNIILKQVQEAEYSAIIALGGGVSKHYVLNANIFRDGVDYAVYITTAESFDGSDSGGNTEEAITWAKIKPEAMHVKVTADATLVFPLLVAATFARETFKNKA